MKKRRKKLLVSHKIEHKNFEIRTLQCMQKKKDDVASLLVYFFEKLPFRQPFGRIISRILVQELQLYF